MTANTEIKGYENANRENISMLKYKVAQTAIRADEFNTKPEVSVMEGD